MIIAQALIISKLTLRFLLKNLEEKKRERDDACAIY